ncbi:hypothetical protein ACFSJW_07795 [Flavobacterium artemisiae]|uniref:Uncharacterized protein n=1 Tax=Flavobacterium artemisiae TaxID=2126556 RepID=A0ABW4HFX4_9FLAO
MKSPTTYSEWANLLDQFGNGNDHVLEDMTNGSFIIDAGVANRFYSKAEETYKLRKQNWLDKFQRAFQFQNLKSEDDFEIALRNGKQNLITLNKFISIKSFPEDLQKTFKNDLDDFIAEIRNSLQKNNSNRNEKITILLKSFQLNLNVPEQEISPKELSKNNTIISPTGRKIIF